MLRKKATAGLAESPPTARDRGHPYDGCAEPVGQWSSVARPWHIME
ncbi:hypothetical protein [Streptomyces sp. NPDC023588]